MNQFGQNPPLGDPRVHAMTLAPLPSVRLPSSGRSALLTYEPYYGLKEKPFSLSVDPRFLYKSQSHAPVFDDLLAGIRRREGLIVLTGDIGMGKTTLCRGVLEVLDRKTFSTFVPDPFVSREDLLKMLLIDFGVMSVDDLRSGRLTGASRPDLSYPLYEFLNSLLPLQAFAVLIIDEAQNLSVPLLEEIRILSDLEAPEKLLQVVLVGQLEFRSKLKLPEMRQLDQRVSVRCELKALNREGVAGYITHRLQVAGGARDHVSFSSEAVDLICGISTGVPRLINLICDRALHRGHLMRAAQIDADTVRAAVSDLGLAEARVAPPPASPASERDTARQARGNDDRTNAEEKAHHTIFDTFDEQDLLHAVHAGATRPAETAPEVPEQWAEEQVAAVPPSADHERPLALLVESSQGKWGSGSFFARPRPRRHTRRRAAFGASAALLMAAVVGGSYWQSREEERRAPIVVPTLPPPPTVRVAAPGVRPAADAVPLTRDQHPDSDSGRSAAAPGSKGVYAIDVALFNSTTRARRLVDELTAAGYHAYQRDLDLGDRGRLHEVLVGLYATRDAADTDLARIRAIRGYQDATLTAAP
jgi:type II secretory pathway predicted ATPase ExeA/cell division septation protein DedD